jgi:hypothetical protein
MIQCKWQGIFIPVYVAWGHASMYHITVWRSLTFEWLKYTAVMYSVCVHMYVYTCMCMYVCVYIHTYICIYIYTYIYTYIYIYIHTCVHTYTNAQTFMDICIYAWITPEKSTQFSALKKIRNKLLWQRKSYIFLIFFYSLVLVENEIKNHHGCLRSD